MGVPGDSFAMRVARVTPFMSINSPSVPRTTHGAAMPTIDAPKKRICRCSFTGSAPLRRLGGTRNVRGSTSTNGEGIGGFYRCAEEHAIDEPQIEAVAKGGRNGDIVN